ncbi:hypothetical protein NHX12_010495 [Muraenolepis orangiensis]|uniref:Uncharacterized protein n=1 Tax=Muraenolepis orangiensis TaxID=630683 RepID=A0A9Q0DN93_9TELE|nr:hypothetical protein NHX12_010495 [Muraenolepis orangiensis]
MMTPESGPRQENEEGEMAYTTDLELDTTPPMDMQTGAVHPGPCCKCMDHSLSFSDASTQTDMDFVVQAMNQDYAYAYTMSVSVKPAQRKLLEL